MDLELLRSTLADLGQPSFRGGQVWAWLARGASSYEEMTDLPAGLRETLAETVPLSTLRLVEEVTSSDGTLKALFHTHDGHPVETVLMRYRDGRSSLCVSSQSGCPLTCTFCATGAMRFGRNLTPAEIVGQALHFRPRARLTNCVFMGMGEPMMNLGPVVSATELLPDLGITNRRTTVSTVGWVPGMREFNELERPLRLALSLHAPEDELRSRVMPVNDRYPLDEVLGICREHHAKRRRRVFVEYVMLAGVNDSAAQARQLAALLGREAFKVNLIPYNPSGSPYEGSTPKAIEAFREALEAKRVPVTVRMTRGRDIAAACGQLAASA